jgi:hypothetical protein
MRANTWQVIVGGNVFPKTFREWVVRFILSICLLAVVGTDCPIHEPKPSNSMYYLHKFKVLGLRHEIGVCIQTGWIVWVNGPHVFGAWPDLKIVQEKLVFVM